ncbi:Regulator of chromosome condensation (RCC1) family protein [Striga hermonthica]|uniref:Regulator of chromosome condensation (RCC1) family protein n=1 Tax=Striga hermonthica TaxID=68872 RepID=A0A9N7NSM0_STRHE|nr:Regulator of chromosome condensation (RCC1) family protein [Striga hermonthica]
MEQLHRTAREDEAVEQQQVIWSWGAGTEGQLATGSLRDEHSPQLLRSLSTLGPPIISLSCGGAHVIAVSAGGRVVTWGRGTSGQLGHGETINSLEPKIVESFAGFVITNVSAGWNHSGFVSEDGAIFTCGDGSFGQLGHGDYKSQCSPQKVLYFGSKNALQVACGMRHSLVLIRGNVENQVYGFGSGKRGQLGISRDKVKLITVPQITMGLTNIRIISVSANGDHSAALSDDGSLYTWGRGFGCASDACVPSRLDTKFSIDKVALGWNHALLLTREMELFMLGGNRHGALTDLQKTSLSDNVPGKSKEGVVKIIPDQHVDSKILNIAAGAEHSALVTENGSIMTWGWGEHGQLGLGNSNDQTAPQVVSLGSKYDDNHAISNVYCGSGFTFVLRAYNDNKMTEN